MKRNIIILSLLALTLFAASCKKSEDMSPVQPGETVTFKDQVYKFTFKAPKAWTAESTPGVRTSYYSTQESEIRFQKFSEGDYGGMMEVGVKNPSTVADAMNEFKTNFILEGANFTGPENVQVGNVAAQKISFSVGTDDDAYMGYRLFMNKDSVVTYFQCATFGKKRMDKYKAVFDMAQASLTPGYVLVFTPGKIDSATMEQLKKEATPSPSMSSYNGNGYTIEYPDNFNAQATSKGIKFEGDWKGASIMVDVIPSNNASLDAFADAAAKALGGSASAATVGGQAGKVINYSATSSYGSRAYVTVKGANAYRISINWPKEMEASFKPAMEKSAASFKLK